MKSSKDTGSGVERVPWGINTAPTERNTNSNYEYLGSGSKRHRKSLTGFSHPASFASTEPEGDLPLSFDAFTIPPLPSLPPRVLRLPSINGTNPFCSYFRINPLPFPHLVSCRKLISNYAGYLRARIEKRGRSSLRSPPTESAFRSKPFSLLASYPGFFNFRTRFDLVNIEGDEKSFASLCCSIADRIVG